MRRVSNSEFSTLKRCRRKWWLGHYRELHRRPKYDDISLPREVGNGVHKALQEYYTPGPFDEPESFREMAAFFDELRDSHDNEQADEIDKSESLANRMLEGYFDWIAETGVDVGLEVEETEVSVGTELNGFIFSAKMDARLKNLITNGSQYMDHKTTGSFDAITKLLAMNEQGLTYQLIDLMTRDETERVDGGIFNMIRRVKRTAAAEPPFYERVMINHGIQTIDSFYQRVLGYTDSIRELEQKLDEGQDPRRVCPPTANDSCAWSCSFFTVCVLFDESPQGAEDKLGSYYEKYDPYERYNDVKVDIAVTSKGDQIGS